LQAQSRTQFLIYFWCGAAARAGRFNTFFLHKFLRGNRWASVSQRWGFR